MSKSIHVTRKNFKGLTKEELSEQFHDPGSDLAQWTEKRILKKEEKDKRKKKSTDKNQLRNND